MKNLFLLLLFLPTISFGQGPTYKEWELALKQWVYSYNGNPIDGHVRQAMRISKFTQINELWEESQEEISFVLSINSSAESLRIENSIGGNSDEDNRDDVYIEVYSASFIEPTIGLNDVFIYFDNEKTYYKVNYTTSGGNIYLFNAIEKNDAGFLSRFDLIEKLKVKNELFFRFKYSDGTEKNVAFSLKGSSSIINKVVDLSLIQNEDWIMDGFMGDFAIAYFVNSDKIQNFLSSREISTEKFGESLLKIQNELLGEYSTAFIKDYEFDNGMIEFYNLNDELVEKVHYNKILNAIN